MGKSTLTNCHSFDSGGHGFHIGADAEVDLINCTATRSGLSGFYFGQQAVPLRKLVDAMRQQLAVDPTFAKNAVEFHSRLDEVQGALDNPATTKKGMKAMLTTLKEKLLEKSGTLAGHAIFYLLEKAPDIIDSIQHMKSH